MNSLHREHEHKINSCDLHNYVDESSKLWASGIKLYSLNIVQNIETIQVKKYLVFVD